ncbi:mRNA-processing endoribonuclease [Saccharomycopsis crataegensis]|uniref:Transcriptional protein SWT1 n=1 Tax=Saccharomycopsis crataegensis TaxID=43959 RepID=A0AAV5QGJ9_9ASCO|nr:mRNA-processing endoribonuclease [Saccharomycopsis crataegensis]
MSRNPSGLRNSRHHNGRGKKNKTLDDLMNELDDFERQEVPEKHQNLHLSSPDGSPNTKRFRGSQTPNPLTTIPDEDGDLYMVSAEESRDITNYVNESRKINQTLQLVEYTNHNNDLIYANSIDAKWNESSQNKHKPKEGLLKSRYADDNYDDNDDDDDDDDSDKPTKSTKNTEPSPIELDRLAQRPLPIIPDFQIYLVVDTNFFISNLNIVNNLNLLAVRYHYQLIVPEMVIQELDGLKEGKRISRGPRGEEIKIGTLAQRANTWLYNQFAARSSTIRGQTRHEKIDRSLRKDNAIFDCCMYFHDSVKEKGLVILLSNDRNICVKALMEDVLTVSFVEGINSQFIGDVIYKEAQYRVGRTDSVEKPFFENIIPSQSKIVNSERPPQKTANPYLNLGSPERFCAKIFHDVQALTLTLFKHYLQRLIISYDPISIEYSAFQKWKQEMTSLDAVFRMMKAHWAEWSLQMVFTRNTPMAFELQEAQFYNGMRMDFDSDSSLFSVWELESAGKEKQWKISKPQERVIFKPPKTLFQIKKFLKFWCLVLTKLILVLDDGQGTDGTETRSMCMLMKFWDGAVTTYIDSDWVDI